jgi:hypothetical protein
VRIWKANRALTAKQELLAPKQEVLTTK